MIDSHVSRQPLTYSRFTCGLVFTVLLGLFLFLWAQQALAQDVLPEPQLIDRVVAIVDEEMILQSDLDREIELYHLEREYAGVPVTATDSEIREEVLSRLVESKLIIAAAKQADITVEEQVIEEGVQGKIDQLVEHFGSEEALERELVNNGLTLSDYRERLTTQLTDQHYLRAVISRFIRPNIEVMENELYEYYEDHADEMPATPDSVSLAGILTPVQSSPDVRQEVQRKVAEVVQALSDGQAFADVAKEYSEGPNADRGGTVGVVKQGDLFDDNLEKVVFQLNEGEYSQPVLSQRGVHIVHLDAITPDGRAISQVFFPMEVTQADVDAAQDQANAVYQRLQNGESFALVAEEVSGDPVTARQGGHMGTFNMMDLSPQFQEALQDIQKGDFTEPVLTPSGIYIFLLEDRIPGHEYTFEEVKEEIRQALESQKMEAELTKYVESLRQLFYIDMKS